MRHFLVNLTDEQILRIKTQFEWELSSHARPKKGESDFHRMVLNESIVSAMTKLVDPEALDAAAIRRELAEKDRLWRARGVRRSKKRRVKDAAGAALCVEGDATLSGDGDEGVRR